MRITEDTSQKIKNMSLLCAAFVVTSHIGLPGGIETSSWLVDQLLVQGIAPIAVPFFFVVSGFFLAAHFNEDGWWRRELGKRVPSLVVPFFIWSFLCVITSLPLPIVADLAAHRPFGTSICMLQRTNWLRIFGVDLTEHPILYPLWYVRCLMFFVIASPVISFLLKKLGLGWLLFCFVLNLFYGHISCPELRNFFLRCFSLSGLFYFSVGLFLQRHRNLTTTKRVARISLFVGIGLLVVKAVFFYNICRSQFPFGSIAIPFLMYAIWHYMSVRKLPEWLTSCSFPIFVMHVLFFPYIAVVICHLQVNDKIPTLLPTLNFIVGFFGSIIVTVFFRRYLPKLSRVLFGGR